MQIKSNNWIKNNIVSITEVEMSPDLKVAKIYLSFLMEKGKDEAYDLINSHKGEIRKELGLKIGKTVRSIPELIFYLDKGAEHAQKMDEIFRNLDIPSSDESDNEE